MPANHTEQAFEQAIESILLDRGYEKGDPARYDKASALFPDDVISFVKATQPELWLDLESLHKARAGEVLLGDLARALDSDHEGSLAVIRHGFKCFGKLVKMAFFEPASGMNPETTRLYGANILKVTRQVRYSLKNENSVDMLISLNGMPVATIELKNQFTGQTWQDAVLQYKNDRDPEEPLFKFKKRALVHFAADTGEAYMATKLSGQGTVFLPFNRGLDKGAGNPPNPEGYQTDYLWSDILSRQSLLDILARFIHLQTEEKDIAGRTVKKETMIFPRYHQLDCVRKVIADARMKGAGTDYLIQHSAGSGKSNSIAWLAHRLASLHNESNEKVFDSVIVVTDRLVLDQQLQNTVYQFEHKQGVVEKIDKNSEQLAQAITHGTPIIITTLQKFPFVADKIERVKNYKYAVIIDEAHSSQGGEAAIDMKGVLGDIPDFEDELAKRMLARGKQTNISFFAFTATPKYKTLEVFGTKGLDGKPEPFHLYSMRQAIEEGFILDVLRNYTSYALYFELIKSIADDPQVKRREGAKALARFVSFHPYNIAQKVEVMLEHFIGSTSKMIGGNAKAMVVTSSRLHAVRYKQEFDRQIEDRELPGIKTLVAFSGVVDDPENPCVQYDEASMNGGLKEKELPAKFDTKEYQILIVADKYQTGFDQPLLHTMYVDKRLSGVQAVQTLSRLNRTCSGKESTFVLDFVNEPEEILKSFQPYYETTGVGERVQVGQLYSLQADIMNRLIIDMNDVESFCHVFYDPSVSRARLDHPRMNATVDKAVQRFRELDKDSRLEFKKKLVAYRNLYSFMSQIIPFQDSDLEKLYSYIRFLILKLPKDGTRISYNFNEEVEFSKYRLEKIFESRIELANTTSGQLDGPTDVGTGKYKDSSVNLQSLIDVLNKKFKTSFKPGDQYLFDSIREDALSNEKIVKAAKVNTIENFAFVFMKELERLFLERLEQNEEISTKYMSQDDFRDVVGNHIMRDVYSQVNGLNL